MPPAADVAHPIDDSPSASGHSADQADAALNRRRRRHQRIIAALTSLRFGCFLGMVAAVTMPRKQPKRSDVRAAMMR